MKKIARKAPKKKKKRWLYDHRYGKDYVRARLEGDTRNGVYVVLVWKGAKSPNGEPDGEWAMPAALGMSASVAQAAVWTQKIDHRVVRDLAAGAGAPDDAEDEEAGDE